MSILIKGIKMPTSCMLCPFCVEEADPANGEMCMATGTLMPPCTRERLDNCPLVPVPPHGRLIDGDALYKRMRKERNRIAHTYGENDEFVRCLEVYAMEMVTDAPTVIRASEKGGET